MDVNSIDSIVTDPPAGIAFMGKDWDKDKGGRDAWIAWMITVAAECLRLLKPGGHALVWALPRTSHWTATAWEDAGFEVRDRVSHVFGSGFPKSHNISKAIDKMEGKLGVQSQGFNTAGGKEKYNPINKSFRSDYGYKYETSTPEAQQWDGWGTALKPSMEDWWLLRKPCSEKTVAQNVLRWGTGALNIDASRVEFANDKDRNIAEWTSKGSAEGWGLKSGADVKPTHPQGRWPANIIHDGSDEVLEMFPETKSGSRNGVYNGSGFKSPRPSQNGKVVNPTVGDSGSAARFFYAAKPSKRERDAGCEGLEAKFSPTMGNGIGGKEHDPETATPKRNSHPCVKAQALMRYLITLVTPPSGTVLDCFMGSGSTGVAAKGLGFDFIGIEKDAEYFRIAQARISEAESG